MEEEVGLFDEKGVIGFAPYFVAALRNGILLTEISWSELSTESLCSISLVYKMGSSSLLAKLKV